MSRAFGATAGGASTDRINLSGVPTTTGARSVSLWFNRIAAGSRMWDGGVAGTMLLTSGVLEWQRGFSTTGGAWRPSGGAFNSAGVWNHLVLIWDTTTSAAPVAYVNGVSASVSTQTSPVGTPNALSGATDIGNRSDGIRVFEGLLEDFAVWTKALSAIEVQGLYQGRAPGEIARAALIEWLPLKGGGSPRSMLRPMTNVTRIGASPRENRWSPPQGKAPYATASPASVPALTPGAGQHGHTADAVTLVSRAALTPADAGHAHGAEAVVMGAGLIIADALSDHAATAATLSTASALTPAAGALAHSASSPTLAAASALAGDAAMHGHSATAPTIGASAALSVAAAAHAHAADVAGLSVGGALNAAAASHGHSAASATLAAKAALAIAAAVHAHGADVAGLASRAALTAANGLHGHSADVALVSARAALTPGNGLHGHISTSVTLASRAAIAADSAGHGHLAQAALLAAASALAIGQCLHGHSADAASVGPTIDLSPPRERRRMFTTAPRGAFAAGSRKASFG